MSPLQIMPYWNFQANNNEIEALIHTIVSPVLKMCFFKQTDQQTGRKHQMVQSFGTHHNSFSWQNAQNGEISISNVEDNVSTIILRSADKATTTYGTQYD